jgi:hypothetical protein
MRKRDVFAKELSYITRTLNMPCWTKGRSGYLKVTFDGGVVELYDTMICFYTVNNGAAYWFTDRGVSCPTQAPLPLFDGRILALFEHIVSKYV